MDSLNYIINLITQGSVELTLEVQLRFFFVVFLLGGLFNIIKQVINMCRRI